MTLYEWFRWFTFPIMPVHLQTVRKDILKLIGQNAHSKTYTILDVGGRKSPYTIGIPASVILLDVPQEDDTQKALQLGFTKDILSTIKNKRSNIKDLIIQDMTKSNLQQNNYDAVACIEVIEHVTEDDLFIKNVASVLKSGGWAYFTTPNGDFIKNEGPDKNPDHVRHYTRDALYALLKKHFDSVEVHYAVKTGKHRVKGLRGYSLRKPFKTIQSMASNVMNNYESRGLRDTAIETAHLVAIVYK